MYNQAAGIVRGAMSSAPMLIKAPALQMKGKTSVVVIQVVCMWHSSCMIIFCVG